MEAFASIRGRIGAARVVLASDGVSAAEQELVSRLQCDAILSMLHSCKLESTEKARLVDMVLGVRFHEQDRLRILDALGGGGGGGGGGNSGTQGVINHRRPMQNFTSFLEYLSTFEWDRLESCKCSGNKNGMMQIFLDVLIHRLHCVNPSEFTINRVTAALLVASSTPEQLSMLTASDKATERLVLQKTWKRIARKCKNDFYLSELPVVPGDLERMIPIRFAAIKVAGCWTPSRLDTRLLTQIEAGLCCRGNRNLAKLDGQQSQSLCSQNMLTTMCLQMQHAFLKQMQNDREPLITFTKSPSKCEQNLQSIVDAAARSGSSNELQRCRSLVDFNEAIDVVSPRPLKELMIVEPSKDAQVIDDVAMPPSEIVDPLKQAAVLDKVAVPPVEIVKHVDHVAESLANGAKLLDALVERDADRKREAAAKKKEKNAEETSTPKKKAKLDIPTPSKEAKVAVCFCF